MNNDVLIKTHNPLKHWNRLKFWNHVYPKIPRDQTRQNTWNALELTSPEETRCVILGDNTPSCIAWNCLPHSRLIPRTTQNVLREYVSDLGYRDPRSGDLRAWCRRGVLLLPTQLGRDPHWRLLTFEILRTLDTRADEPIAFHFWGSDAGQFASAVRRNPRHITSHPSEIGAKNTFAGSKPFSWTNSVLKAPIDWRLE